MISIAPILIYSSKKQNKMKNLNHSESYSNKKSLTVQLLNGIKNYAALLFFSIILVGVFTGCEKQDMKPVKEPGSSQAKRSDGNVVNDYTGLSSKTAWELKQARAATARYRDIKNAIKDGYSNINVDVPNMGHHFMKTSIVDATFDIRNPEILVYNGLDTGNPELVAVEYAVPLTDPRPEGFTGSADVWKDDSGFPFWLVHAWVWKFNPDGVFNWTNSSVDLD
jgi:hypothetical protein